MPMECAHSARTRIYLTIVWAKCPFAKLKLKMPCTSLTVSFFCVFLYFSYKISFICILCVESWVFMYQIMTNKNKRSRERTLKMKCYPEILQICEMYSGCEHLQAQQKQKNVTTAREGEKKTSTTRDNKI